MEIEEIIKFYSQHRKRYASIQVDKYGAYPFFREARKILTYDDFVQMTLSYISYLSNT